MIDEGSNAVALWKTGRSVLEGRNGDNSSLILAEGRTRRKDPKDDFKYYTGGWNISEDHYISVSLTKPFYVCNIHVICVCLKNLALLRLLFGFSVCLMWAFILKFCDI